MARTDAQRARARAQRATAARVRTRTRILPKAFTAPSKQAQIDYAYAVMRGDIARPAQNTPEARQLAHMAALASWQKADPAFEQAFSEYWYHKEGDSLNEDEDIDYDDMDADDEEE
jgi:hypothetical protein